MWMACYVGGSRLFPVLPTPSIDFGEVKQVIFISNNSTKSRHDYIQKFERLGIPVIEDELVLSTYATAQYVADEKPGAKVYMAGFSGLTERIRTGSVGIG